MRRVALPGRGGEEKENQRRGNRSADRGTEKVKGVRWGNENEGNELAQATCAGGICGTQAGKGRGGV